MHEYLVRGIEHLNTGVAQRYRYLCEPYPPWRVVRLHVAEGCRYQRPLPLFSSTEQDEAIIGNFLELYEPVVLDVLMFAFNAPVLVLNTLNYCPDQKAARCN